jgi:hypothetical protein
VADDDDVADHDRRAAPGVREPPLERRGEIHASAGAEIRIVRACLGIERHEVLAPLHEDALVVTVGPIRDAARDRARVAVQPFIERLFDPPRRARSGIERLDEADTVRRVEHAIDHQRRRPVVIAIAEAGHLLENGRIDGRTPPCDS